VSNIVELDATFNEYQRIQFIIRAYNTFIKECLDGLYKYEQSIDDLENLSDLLWKGISIRELIEDKNNDHIIEKFVSLISTSKRFDNDIWTYYLNDNCKPIPQILKKYSRMFLDKNHEEYLTPKEFLIKYYPIGMKKGSNQ
jgi:hypothetical protein